VGVAGGFCGFVEAIPGITTLAEDVSLQKSAAMSSSKRLQAQAGGVFPGIFNG
jgi:hypothetical protein